MAHGRGQQAAPAVSASALQNGAFAYTDGVSILHFHKSSECIYGPLTLQLRHCIQPRCGPAVAKSRPQLNTTLLVVRRDSKLTRVLASSLAGAGARIAIIACVTPAASQAEETANTLKFTTRAKKVLLPMCSSQSKVLEQ